VNRYEQLLQIIEQTKPRTIIEVGTWNGLRAVQMATEALRFGPVHYVGLDLFEEATAETDAAELNVKAHCTIDEVHARLTDLQAQDTRFTFTLWGGNTNDTLPEVMKLEAMEGPSLAFIDGGHSVETIRNDYEHLKGCDFVVLDDLYQPDDRGCPDVDKYGCNHLLESIGTLGVDWFILPVGDPVVTGGRVHMATVGFNPPIAVTKKLVVKTKNSVDDGVILAHVSSALSRGLPEMQACRRHGREAVVVSGGPTFKLHVAEIKARQDAGAYVFCVKTSHDWLIANGVVPFGCILLDPRPHVLDFVSDPHPDVTYFVASQVHPATLDRLQERGSKIVLYHALVGAGEANLLAGKSLVVGGSTSATRGISMLNALGFAIFDLYGYDSCFQSKPGDEYTFEGDGKRPIDVKINGRAFWTTPELIAQAQDFEKLAEMAVGGNAIELEVHGDGVIPHIWSKMRPNKADFGVEYGIS